MGIPCRHMSLRSVDMLRLGGSTEPLLQPREVPDAQLAEYSGLPAELTP